MRLCAIGCLVIGLVAAAGCSRQDAVSCDTDPRYSRARSAPPVQVPDDLSPPSESDALRLPPDAGGAGAAVAGPCLQTPPSFFGESRPFEVDAESENGPSRRARREARREERRAARGDAGADRPAEPTEQRDAPSDAPQDDDRVIDN